jgi:hypothetical protein
MSLPPREGGDQTGANDALTGRGEPRQIVEVVPRANRREAPQIDRIPQRFAVRALPTTRRRSAATLSELATTAEQAVAARRSRCDVTGRVPT